MPDVAGFSSASVTYAVQAAANGTTLPVNVEVSALTVLSGATATGAASGTNGDVPAQVVGYVIVNIAGTNRKIPYYA
jgi:hypothetical protein